MAEIDREQLLHVAHLARLELRDDEVERLGAQLNDILEAVSKVSELDLSDVPPTSHPLDVVNVWGDDEPRPSLPVEEALANAPEREGDFFKVPPGGARDRHAAADRRGGDAPARRQGGLERRALRRVPRGDRRARPRAALLPPRLRRRRRRGRPARGEGRDRDEGDPDDGRLEDPRGLRAGLRRDRRRALQGARPARPRQDEHRRVRDGLVDRELRVRADAQPVGSDARAGRLGRRLGSRGARRARAVGARLRHRRLDQAAGGALRQRRPPPDVRHGLALRRRRVRVEPRPGRAGRAERARLRAPLLDPRGPRPVRLDDGRAAAARSSFPSAPT